VKLIYKNSVIGVDKNEQIILPPPLYREAKKENVH